MEGDKTALYKAYEKLCKQKTKGHRDTRKEKLQHLDLGKG